MYDIDKEKISKFFNMIDEILEHRKNLLKGGSFKQYISINKHSLPAIVIFIDNYSGFREKTEGKFEDIVIKLSKEGNSKGIFLVTSGVGFGMNDISNRIAENIKSVLTLSLQDKFAYADLLHTMNIDVIPESDIKGRGLGYYGDRVLEYQAALAVDAENDYERLQSIKEICNEMKQSWTGKSARHIPEIPQKPVWTDLSENDEYENYKTTRRFLVAGYYFSNAQLYGIDLDKTYCFGVYGAKRTGKTNFMKICVKSALDMKANICIIDSPESAMYEFAGDDITYCNSDETIFNYFKELTPEFQKRNSKKHELLREGYSTEEVSALMREATEPHFIFISDLSWFTETIYNSEYNIRGFLETIFAKGECHNIYFIASHSLEKSADARGYKLFDTFTSYGCGINMGGKVIDNSFLNFEGMSYSDQMKSEKIGIGVLPIMDSNNKINKIVVPLAKDRVTKQKKC